MSNNIQTLREIAIDMAEGINIIAKTYNAFISIKEKVINLHKDINDIRSKSYMSQNLLEKCFERFGEMIVRTEDVSSVSSKTKNINTIGLDMLSHSRKSQATVITNNIRTGDISLSKDKNISKCIQEMSILQNDKSLKDKSLPKDKYLPSGDDSPSNDILLPKGENPYNILFFPNK